MVSLNWCKKQKSGIRFIEPNLNLAREYIKNAQDTLLSLKDSKEPNLWKATKKYYCEYFSIYSFLIRIGIRCEIHDCTIEILRGLGKENFLPKNIHKRLKDDKQLRIDNQYYLKDKEVKLNYDELLYFVLEIKNKINSISQEEINRIRCFLRK